MQSQISTSEFSYSDFNYNKKDVISKFKCINVFQITKSQFSGLYETIRALHL